MKSRSLWNWIGCIGCGWFLAAVALSMLILPAMLIDSIFDPRTIEELVWGADSQALYASYRDSEDSESYYALFQFDLEGNTTQVYRQAAPIYSLSISPDQTHAAFISYDVDQSDSGTIHHVEDQSILLVEIGTGETSTINTTLSAKSNLQWAENQLYFESDGQHWLYDPASQTTSPADPLPTLPYVNWEQTTSPDGQWQTQFTCHEYSVMSSDTGADSYQVCSKFDLTLTETATQANQWTITQNALTEVYGLPLKYFFWTPPFALIGVLLMPALTIPALWSRGSQHIARAGVVIIVLYYGLFCVVGIMVLLS